MSLSVTKVTVKDIRFPTSKEKHGSDAMHPDPDYSCAYVWLHTEDETLTGHGLTFTIGKGTEIVVKAIESLAALVIDHRLDDIFNDFSAFWRSITSHGQLRWIGPEKGVIHLATSAIVNALWDLWAKIEKKPLWKLLVDMKPETLVSTIDFRYIEDVLTKEEAIQILKSNQQFHKERGLWLNKMHIFMYKRAENEMKTNGFPAYTTSAAWIGYKDEEIKERCKQALAAGFTYFKAKVGDNLENDKKRLNLIREEIGYDNFLMVDANQKWGVNQAIEWMKELASFKPLWIEEPTSPDDVLGHLKIANELKDYGIKVALGEQCQNRVIFKQLLQSGAMQFCQLDATRLGGLNEVLAVVLMASKFGVPVCPHAGGVGLCEYVSHVSIWDYIAVSGSTENRIIEYVDHLHDIFLNPADTRRARYFPSSQVGYGGHIKNEVVAEFEFPNGSYWSKLWTGMINN